MPFASRKAPSASTSLRLASSKSGKSSRASPRLSSINHYITRGLNTILNTKRNSLNSDRSNCAFGFFVWRKCHEQIQLPCAGGTVSLAQPQEQAAGQIPAVRNGGARNPVCNGGAPATGLARRLHRDGRGAARARGHSRALRESGLSAQETSDERDHRPRARERSLNSRSQPYFFFPARRCFGGGLYTAASSFMPSGSVK